MLLMIFLSMPTPHEYLIPSFILCGSALKSWLRNASAVTATVQLCSATLGMCWGCLWTCALGGARYNSHSSLDRLGLDGIILLFLRRFWAVRCMQHGLFWKALYWPMSEACLFLLFILKLLVFVWSIFVECVWKHRKKHCEGRKFSQK